MDLFNSDTKIPTKLTQLDISSSRNIGNLLNFHLAADFRGRDIIPPSKYKKSVQNHEIQDQN